MTAPKLKLALVGCGYMGKRYVELLSHHPQGELSAIIDTDASRLAAYKNYCCFDALHKFFHSGVNADAMIIATPNGTHASLAIECLRQKKHVLIEKPMALNHKDAEAIKETAKSMGCKLMVVLQNRFSPVSLWLKQLIGSKRLGRIFFVQVNGFWNRDDRYYQKDNWHGSLEMDGGTLFTQFSHFIDLLYWLFGDVTNISSRFQNCNHPFLPFEDTGSIRFDFQLEGMGCFHFTTAAWDKTMESSLTIIAENGSVKVSGQYINQIEYCHIRDYSLPDIPESNAVNNHLKMLEATIKTFRENGCTNAEDALRSVDVIERMYAAAKHERNAMAAVK